MPELPEVEITKRSLSKHILNQKIEAVTILNPKLRYRLKKKIFSQINGKKILKVTRKSKYILVEISSHYTLLIHLGMTGRFYFLKDKTKKIETSFYANNKILKKHDHLKISFKKFDLIYNDIRKFGFIKLYKNKSFLEIPHTSKLGPEPLSSIFNKKYLTNKLNEKKVSIKNFLMNQQNISGLGNIYVNEALYMSGIHPLLESKKIKPIKIEILVRSIKKIMKKAILMGGSTIENYHNSEGKTGSYQSNFKVYDRDGQRCLSKGCKSIIKRKLEMGRSIYFCPKCQRI